MFVTVAASTPFLQPATLPIHFPMFTNVYPPVAHSTNPINPIVTLYYRSNGVDDIEHQSVQK